MLDVCKLITEAFDTVLGTLEDEIPAPNDKVRNSARSTLWVDALGRAFQTHYDGKAVVFWRGCSGNRKDFRLNEFLSDVMVCETATCTPPRRKDVTLTYVVRGLWQVESEFSEDARAAVIDFSKLVVGTAANKLFIAPHTSKPVSFRETLLDVAAVCPGNVFLAQIPHPRDWTYGDSAVIRVNVFEFVGKQWEPLPLE